MNSSYQPIVIYLSTQINQYYVYLTYNSLFIGATDVWIGLYRPSTSTDLNDIRYSSDGQLIGYTQWGGGQPNNNNGQESVVMALSSANYRWFDKTRTEIGKFICEI